MAFSPARIQAKANQKIDLLVENTGDIAHTFSVNELDLEVKVNPGEERRLRLNAPAGAYPFVCRILDHEGLGMVGQLVVS